MILPLFLMPNDVPTPLPFLKVFFWDEQTQKNYTIMLMALPSGHNELNKK